MAWSVAISQKDRSPSIYQISQITATDVSHAYKCDSLSTLVGFRASPSTSQWLALNALLLRCRRWNGINTATGPANHDFSRQPLNDKWTWSDTISSSMAWSKLSLLKYRRYSEAYTPIGPVITTFGGSLSTTSGSRARPSRAQWLDQLCTCGSTTASRTQTPTGLVNHDFARSLSHLNMAVSRQQTRLDRYHSKLSGSVDPPVVERPSMKWSTGSHQLCESCDIAGPKRQYLESFRAQVDTVESLTPWPANFLQNDGRWEWSFSLRPAVYEAFTCMSSGGISTMSSFKSIQSRAQ